MQKKKKGKEKNAGDFSAGADASEKAHDTHTHPPGQVKELAAEGTVVHGELAGLNLEENGENVAVK